MPSSSKKNSVADAMITYHNEQEKTHRANSSKHWNDYVSTEKRSSKKDYYRDMAKAIENKNAKESWKNIRG
ncbi:hypothetical protein DTO212C5_6869 [Paecilomyces variotii]|nr:hypothetical protein DTO212C5_6869 [Paecilomyces variotii]